MQIEAYKYVVRAIQRHKSAVVLSDVDVSSNSPKQGVADKEFPWIHHVVPYDGDDDDDDIDVDDETGKLVIGQPNFAAPGITTLRMPSSLALTKYHLAAFFRMLPNLESITFGHNTGVDINSSFKALEYGETNLKTLHQKLREIVFVRCNLFLVESLIDKIRTLDRQRKAAYFPLLQAIRMVACEEFDEAAIEAMPQLRRTPFGLRRWNYASQQFESRLNPTSSPQIEVVPKQTLPELGHLKRRARVAQKIINSEDMYLDMDSAAYLIHAVGLLPFVSFRIGLTFRGAGMSVVDMALNPFAQLSEQQLDSFIVNNRCVDLYSCITNNGWITNLVLEDPLHSSESKFEHVAKLARLAKKYCDGKLLQASILRYILSRIARFVSEEVPVGSESRDDLMLDIDEGYRRNVISMLRVMNNEGWDMYHDDYIHASLCDKAILAALLEIDKENQMQKDSSESRFPSQQERIKRYSQLLFSCATRKAFESVPSLVDMAGADFVNIILRDSVGTIIHAALYCSDMDCVKYLLQKKPLDVRDSLGRSYLHAAAIGKSESACIAVLLDLVPSTIDINTVDNEGNTMLHYLCDQGMDMLARLVVLKFGADPNAKNQDGEYPADWLGDYFGDASKVPKELHYLGFDEQKSESVDATELQARGEGRVAKRKREQIQDTVNADEVEVQESEEKPSKRPKLDSK